MRKYTFQYSLDDPLRSVEHGRILKNKEFLNRLYKKWYFEFKNVADEFPDGKFVELGSGGGFLKEIIPSVITSDINTIPNIDMVFSATNMPFEDNSISAIFMIDAFHHFSDVEEFFRESERVLKENGKIVMIEPWNTIFSRFIYTKFHHELFDPKIDWTFPSSGPLSGSNMALPWIVFSRDQKKFNMKFSNFTLKNMDLHTPFMYLFSGGFSRKQMLPEIFDSLLNCIDNLPSFLMKKFAMFATIEIEKNKSKNE